MKFTPSLAAVLLAFLLSAGGSRASADVFVLSNGGRVTGELVNREESPRAKYIVQTTDGARVTFDAAQVRQVIHPRPNEVEYERIRPTYPDTVRGQWDLAQWCRDHHLSAQREIHLRRVIELDPDHVDARRVLGYGKVDGQWATRDEVMTQRGYVRYNNGKWVLPQEKEQLENKHKLESAQQEWFKKVKLWRAWLGSNRDQEARENFHAIDDPTAVKALEMSLVKDSSAPDRLLYVESLTKIDTPDAVQVLAAASIDNEVDEVRLNCLDHLQAKPRPEVVAYYVRRLQDKKNRDPILINRAALGLGRMKDPSAIGPLIDALITFRIMKIEQPGGDNPTTATFGGRTGSPGGVGMSAGGKPKYVREPSRNQSVLDALVTLTGQNFGFDQQAWRYWCRTQRKPETFDARRN
jgi:hypothetical protein